MIGPYGDGPLKDWENEHGTKCNFSVWTWPKENCINVENYFIPYDFLVIMLGLKPEYLWGCKIALVTPLGVNTLKIQKIGDGTM